MYTLTRMFELTPSRKRMFLLATITFLLVLC